jgi:hypothetical protein
MSHQDPGSQTPPPCAPRSPQRCPLCQQPIPPAFALWLSAMVDWVCLAQHAVNTLKEALEEETLP